MNLIRQARPTPIYKDGYWFYANFCCLCGCGFTDIIPAVAPKCWQCLYPEQFPQERP